MKKDLIDLGDDFEAYVEIPEFVYSGIIPEFDNVNDSGPPEVVGICVLEGALHLVVSYERHNQATDHFGSPCYDTVYWGVPLENGDEILLEAGKQAEKLAFRRGLHEGLNRLEED